MRWSGTPARLRILLTSLLVLVAVGGGLAALTVADRSAATWELAEVHEPAAADVQRLYQALSDAAATSARNFLAGAKAPPELRERYEKDVAVAGPTIGLAAVDREGDSRVAREIAAIGREVPVYTGLIESARISDRQGDQVAATYLLEAAELMRGEILPAAERLYRSQTERVRAERDAAVSTPYLPALLVLAAVLGLVATQIYLARTFRRRLNPGLLVATGAMLAGSVWSMTALGLHTTRAESAKPEAVNQLSSALITAQQARSNELLALVASGKEGPYLAEFQRLTKELAGPDGKSGALDAARDGASGPLASALANSAATTLVWIDASDAIRAREQGGRHSEAIRLAVNDLGFGASAPAFTGLDASMSQAIKAERQLFVMQTVDAARALTALPIGWAALALIAAGGVTHGMWRRLREFR